MSARRAKDWVLAVAGGLILIAGAVLLIANLENTTEFALFWKPLDVSTSWLMLLAAVAGWVVARAARSFIRAVWDLRATRQRKAGSQPQQTER